MISRLDEIYQKIKKSRTNVNIRFGLDEAYFSAALLSGGEND